MPKSFRSTMLYATLSGLGLAGPVAAQTEIQWWHAMTGANNDVIVRLAEEFNASQKDYKVVPAYKGSYADTLNAGIAASVTLYEVAKRRAASGSGESHDTMMPTANDSGMVTSPGFFSGNHAVLCLRMSVWIVGER